MAALAVVAADRMEMGKFRSVPVALVTPAPMTKPAEAMATAATAPTRRKVGVGRRPTRSFGTETSPSPVTVTATGWGRSAAGHLAGLLSWSDAIPTGGSQNWI